MGKAAKVFAVCVFMMLLTACSVEQNIGFTESQSPTVKQEGKQQTIVLPYDGEKLSADPISAASFYREALTEARLPQISAYEVTDYIAVAEKWINSWYIADSFTEKYRTCDYVEAYPILGTYLERTDQIAYLFYEDSIPVGISILTIDEQGTPVEASPYKDMTVKPTVVVPLSAEECFLKIEKCLNKYPGFEIMGIVGDTNGYPNMYPVGKQSGKETIQYMSNEPMDFKLVEPFETLEEGQAAFTAYHIEKQRILSEITLYPWVDATCYYGGYLSKFENSAEYITAQKTGAFTYLEDYDSVIAVPLLSEDLQENEYILHLLYYHNQLIAELVLQRTEDGETVVPVWENVADKTPDGTYIPIETAAYVRVLEQEAEKNTAWENQGVVFSEGQFCPIGLSEGSLMIYKTNTSITETAHADAPRILSLGSVQAYNDLIAASSLNETKLQEFLSVNNYIMNGIRTKEDILVLKKVMDSVPFPVFENAELTVFEINMDYPSMFIRYRMESQNTVQFRISLNAQSAEEKMAAAIRSADTSVESLSTDTMQSLYYTGTSERTTTTALTYIAIVNGHYVTIEVFDTSRENADRYVRSVNFNSLD